MKLFKKRKTTRTHPSLKGKGKKEMNTLRVIGKGICKKSTLTYFPIFQKRLFLKSDENTRFETLILQLNGNPILQYLCAKFPNFL